MKLTIIPADGAVYVDGKAVSGLRLVEIPANVRALQWESNAGWLEFNDGNSNAPVLELPAWAIGAVQSKTDYEAGQAAADAQRLIDMANQPPSPPRTVSRAQFLLALLEIGLLDEVEAAIEQADRATQINYRERLEFERDYPLIATMAAVLGKTDAEIDALFVLAAGM